MENVSMGSHPTIYSVLQLHVVNFNHNVKNGLKLESKLVTEMPVTEMPEATHLQFLNLWDGVILLCRPMQAYTTTKLRQ